jgi:hypothetical protein
MNPSVTLQAVEEVIAPILGTDYDGIVVENQYLYVRSNTPISSENELLIKDRIFTLNNEPQTISVVSVPDPAPFAQPLYRTKRNATASLVIIAADSHEHIDFKLTAERYVSGGCILVDNAEFGDYAEAEVIDVDGVIPEAYRAALCESWPTVAKYIDKEWIEVNEGGITHHKIDTYPLNAKITAGLYLRVTYYTTSAGSSRSIGVNYYLTKKL